MTAKNTTPQKAAAGLTREDIRFHLLAMYRNGERFVIKPRLNPSEKDNSVDYLLCGEHCYGLVIMHDGRVSCFLLRMSPETARPLLKGGRIAPAETGRDGNWFMLPAGELFFTKREMFRILDECYDFALRDFYLKRCARKLAACLA